MGNSPTIYSSSLDSPASSSRKEGPFGETVSLGEDLAFPSAREPRSSVSQTHPLPEAPASVCSRQQHPLRTASPVSLSSLSASRVGLLLDREMRTTTRTNRTDPLLVEQDLEAFLCFPFADGWDSDVPTTEEFGETDNLGNIAGWVLQSKTEKPKPVKLSNVHKLMRSGGRLPIESSTGSNTTTDDRECCFVFVTFGDPSLVILDTSSHTDLATAEAQHTSDTCNSKRSLVVATSSKNNVDKGLSVAATLAEMRYLARWFTSTLTPESQAQEEFVSEWLSEPNKRVKYAVHIWFGSNSSAELKTVARNVGWDVQQHLEKGVTPKQLLKWVEETEVTNAEASEDTIGRPTVCHGSRASNRHPMPVEKAGFLMDLVGSEMAALTGRPAQDFLSHFLISLIGSSMEAGPPDMAVSSPRQFSQKPAKVPLLRGLESIGLTTFGIANIESTPSSAGSSSIVNSCRSSIPSLAIANLRTSVILDSPIGKSGSSRSARSSIAIHAQAESCYSARQQSPQSAAPAVSDTCHRLETLPAVDPTFNQSVSAVGSGRLTPAAAVIGGNQGYWPDSAGISPLPRKGSRRRFAIAPMAPESDDAACRVQPMPKFSIPAKISPDSASYSSFPCSTSINQPPAPYTPTPPFSITKVPHSPVVKPRPRVSPLNLEGTSIKKIAVPQGCQQSFVRDPAAEAQSTADEIDGEIAVELKRPFRPVIPRLGNLPGREPHVAALTATPLSKLNSDDGEALPTFERKVVPSHRRNSPLRGTPHTSSSSETSRNRPLTSSIYLSSFPSSQSFVTPASSLPTNSGPDEPVCLQMGITETLPMLRIPQLELSVVVGQKAVLDCTEDVLGKQETGDEENVNPEPPPPRRGGQRKMFDAPNPLDLSWSVPRGGPIERTESNEHEVKSHGEDDNPRPRIGNVVGNVNPIRRRPRSENSEVNGSPSPTESHRKRRHRVTSDECGSSDTCQSFSSFDDTSSSSFSWIAKEDGDAASINEMAPPAPSSSMNEQPVPRIPHLPSLVAGKAKPSNKSVRGLTLSGSSPREDEDSRHRSSPDVNSGSPSSPRHSANDDPGGTYEPQGHSRESDQLLDTHGDPGLELSCGGSVSLGSSTSSSSVTDEYLEGSQPPTITVEVSPRSHAMARLDGLLHKYEEQLKTGEPMAREDLIEIYRPLIAQPLKGLCLAGALVGGSRTALERCNINFIVNVAGDFAIPLHPHVARYVTLYLSDTRMGSFRLEAVLYPILSLLRRLLDEQAEDMLPPEENHAAQRGKDDSRSTDGFQYLPWPLYEQVQEARLAAVDEITSAIQAGTSPAGTRTSGLLSFQVGDEQSSRPSLALSTQGVDDSSPLKYANGSEIASTPEKTASEYEIQVVEGVVCLSPKSSDPFCEDPSRGKESDLPVGSQEKSGDTVRTPPPRSFGAQQEQKDEPLKSWRQLRLSPRATPRSEPSRSVISGNIQDYVKFRVCSTSTIPKATTRSEHDSCKVLLFCKEGVSRSATFFIGYLMWTRKWNYMRAVEYLRQHREIINPNLGFMMALLRFEKRLSSANGNYDKSLSIVVLHHRDAPFFVVMPEMAFDFNSNVWLRPTGVVQPTLDPRFVYILRNDDKVYYWVGSNVSTMLEPAMLQCVKDHLLLMEEIEGRSRPELIMNDTASIITILHLDPASAQWMKENPAHNEDYELICEQAAAVSEQLIAPPPSLHHFLKQDIDLYPSMPSKVEIVEASSMLGPKDPLLVTLIGADGSSKKAVVGRTLEIQAASTELASPHFTLRSCIPGHHEAATPLGSPVGKLDIAESERRASILSPLPRSSISHISLSPLSHAAGFEETQSLEPESSTRVSTTVTLYRSGEFDHPEDLFDYEDLQEDELYFIVEDRCTTSLTTGDLRGSGTVSSQQSHAFHIYIWKGPESQTSPEEIDELTDELLNVLSLAPEEVEIHLEEGDNESHEFEMLMFKV